MAFPQDDTVTLTAQCLCKANTFETEIPASKLPLRAYVCHCTSCRHLTGALYTADVRWPEPRANVDVSKLRAFNFSKNIDLLFCPTCSSPVFWSWPNDVSHPLAVFTGLLPNDKRDLIEFVGQGFVGDTLDGGASVWLRHPNADGSEMKRFEKDEQGDNAKELPQQWPAPSQLTGYERKKEDAIPIRCKCKGVNFILNRGDYSEVKEEELPWPVDPKTHKKLADLCGCDSCRLQGGVDVFNWTFTEIKLVSFGSTSKSFPPTSTELGELVDAKDPAVGTLVYYRSSPNVQRFFCSRCSACIFYAVNDRTHILDIAVGVLDASDGARAEGLLSWAYGARVSYREDADGGWREGLFDRAERDGEKYRIERDYPKIWKTIKDEEAAARCKKPS